MKINNKKTALVMLMSLCALCYGADKNDDELELPDVTTMISGDSLTAGKDSVPDYKDVLPDINTSQIELPVLNSPSTKGQGKKDKKSYSYAEKDIYAQGVAGGGLPFIFRGDFSVYRASGNSPFSINFSHDAVEGLGSKRAVDGYYFRDTAFNAEKSYYGKGYHNIKASYEFSDDGLQDKSAVITDMVRHTVAASADSQWDLPYGWGIGYGAAGEWYERYGNEYSDDTTLVYLPADKKADVFDFNPFIKGLWHNDTLSFALTAEYGFIANLSSKDNYVKAPGSYSAQSSHRGEFTFDADVTFNTFDFYGSVGVVTGTDTGHNAAVVPFTIGIKYENQDPEVDLPFAFNLCGGIDSYQQTPGELERLYKFSSLSCIPSEVSDWYGKFSLTVPFKDYAEAGASCEYRKTAFNNGVWAPDYSSKLGDSAVYSIIMTDRTDFNTDVNATLSVYQTRLTGGWTAYWMDVPEACYRQSFKVNALYQPNGAMWNTGLSCLFGAGEDFDRVPDIGASFQASLTGTMKLAFELNDVIKLASNTTRKYASSEYKQYSGSAMLLLKFQF